MPIVRHQDRSEQGPFDPASGSETVRCEAGHSHPGEQGSGETVVEALIADPDATTLGVEANQAADVVPRADLADGVVVNPHGTPIGVWGLDLRRVRETLNGC